MALSIETAKNIAVEQLGKIEREIDAALLQSIKDYPFKNEHFVSTSIVSLKQFMCLWPKYKAVGWVDYRLAFNDRYIRLSHDFDFSKLTLPDTPVASPSGESARAIKV